MVVLHCDRCGKKILDEHYYTINIYKTNINSKNTSTNYESDLLNLSKTLASYSSVYEASPYEKLNSQKMYCERCKEKIEEFIDGDDDLPFV